MVGSLQTPQTSVFFASLVFGLSLRVPRFARYDSRFARVGGLLPASEARDFENEKRVACTIGKRSKDLAGLAPQGRNPLLPRDGFVEIERGHCDDCVGG